MAGVDLIQNIANMEGDLSVLTEFVQEVNKSNSTNDKKAVLANFPQIQSFLKVTYDGNLNKYGVTSTNVKKQNNKAASSSKKQASKRQKTEVVKPRTFANIFHLLQALRERQLTGNAAIAAVQKFISDNSPYEDMIYKIIDGDLKIGMGSTNINAVYPDLIAEFKVILANEFNKFAHKVDFEKDVWFSSRKLDGCRCIIKIDEKGEPTFFSREGNSFNTLDNAKPDLRSLGLKNVVFDSEACVLAADGSEDFKACVSQIKRKDFTIQSPRLYLFDYLPMADFLAAQGKATFSERQQRLSEVLGHYSGEVLIHLPQLKIDSAEHLAKETDKAADQKWEGLIVRKDVPYEAKRSNDTLKVKRFLDAEFKVLAVENGTKQMLRDGKKVEVETLGSVVIEYKGNKVNVGSGFTDEERQRIHADPSCIIGKEITVQFFEETSNKQGTASMRFPTKKIIWWEPRDT